MNISDYRKLLFWTPRILTMLFAVFISLFALDVFEAGKPVMEMIAGFLIHLMPTYVIIIVLLISWRWEWVGVVIYFGLGVFYIVVAWGKFPFIAYLSISGTLFVMGVLFLLNWLWKAEIRAK